MAAAFCMRLFNDNCVGFLNRQCATSPACRMAWRGNRRPRASRNGHGETAGGSVQAGMGAARRPEAESKAEWARRGPVGESSGTAGRLRARLAGGPVVESASVGVAGGHHLRWAQLAIA